MFLRHCFSKKLFGREAFHFFNSFVYKLKMMYPTNFWKFLTFRMYSNQLVINQPKTNKMAAIGGQIKLKIKDI